MSCLSKARIATTRASAGMTIAASAGQFQVLTGGRARGGGLAACACSARALSAATTGPGSPMAGGAGVSAGAPYDLPAPALAALRGLIRGRSARS